MIKYWKDLLITIVARKMIDAIDEKQMEMYDSVIYGERKCF